MRSLVLILGLVCVLMAAQQVYCADTYSWGGSTTDNSFFNEATTTPSSLTEEEPLGVLEILRRLAANKGNKGFGPNIGVVIKPSVKIVLK